MTSEVSLAINNKKIDVGTSARAADNLKKNMSKEWEASKKFGQTSIVCQKVWVASKDCKFRQQVISELDQDGHWVAI